MKARRVKGLDPAGTLVDNAERFVATRLDELVGFAPQVFDPAEVEALHDLRIAAKRLRYVLEVTSDLFGPYAPEAGKRTKQLQDLVGDIHDCDVLEPRLLALLDELRDEDVAAVRSGGAPDHADDYRGIELLVVDTRVRRQDLFAQFLTFWTELEREGFAARLRYAISERPVVEA